MITANRLHRWAKSIFSEKRLDMHYNSIHRNGWYMSGFFCFKIPNKLLHQLIAIIPHDNPNVMAVRHDTVLPDGFPGYCKDYDIGAAIVTKDLFHGTIECRGKSFLENKMPPRIVQALGLWPADSVAIGFIENNFPDAKPHYFRYRSQFYANDGTPSYAWMQDDSPVAILAGINHPIIPSQSGASE